MADPTASSRRRRDVPRATTAAAPRRTASTRPVLWHLLLIAGLAFGLHAASLGYGFVWDDEPLVQNNTAIRSLSNLPQLWRTHAFAGTGMAFVPGSNVQYYRPLWTTSLALDHAVWGGGPFGFHLTNVLWHVVPALLVYAVALLLLGSAMPALIAALLFAAHPAHVEAVAWISGRNELLAGSFVLAALWASLRWRHGGSLGLAAAAVAFYALGLLSKESAASLPFLALLWEVSPQAKPARTRFAVLLGLVLATVAFLLVRRAIVAPGHRPDDLALVDRLLNAPRIVFEYLRLLVLPFDLRVMHPPLPVEHSAAAPGVWLPALALVALLAGLWRLRRWDFAVFFGLAWMLIALGPVSGIPATIHPVPIAERYLFLPSAGLAIALAALFRRFLGDPGAGSRSFASVLIPVVLVGAFGLVTLSQAGAWKDNAHFADRMIVDAPGQTAGYFNRGVMALNVGAFDRARQDFEAVTNLAPGDGRAWLFLGRALESLQRIPEATRAYERAATLRPEDPAPHAGLGRLAYARNDFEGAVRHDDDALRLEPGDLDARMGRGVALQAQGRIDEAEKEYRALLERSPGNSAAIRNLASLRARQGDVDGAAASLRALLAREPGNADVPFDLGSIFESQGRYASAESAFREAVRLAPLMAQAHNNHAAVLSRLGRYAEAMREIREAQRLAPANDVFRQNGVIIARDSAAALP